MKMKTMLRAAAVAAALGAVATLGHTQEPIKGYVLTHEHPTGAMAFGGNYAFTGAPGNYKNGIMEKGYTSIVPGCDGLACTYGLMKGSITGKLTGGDMEFHRPHWGPKRNAFSHMRYSTEWIKEAFDPPERRYQDTRMRIMVAFAVESYSMCETLYYANRAFGGPGGAGYPCVRGDSWESNKRQLQAIKNWAKANRDWAEIAYSASDVRRIIAADKLAVILGIESEYDFGAEDRTFDPVKRLNDYYDLGVRTFYLAHKLNSRLAGADIYLSADSMGGKVIRTNQAIAGCLFYDDNVGNFPLENKLGHNFCNNTCGPNHFKGNKGLGLLDSCVRKPSEISEANTVDYILGRGANTFNGFKIYPRTPGFPDPGGTRVEKRYGVDIERNNLGLSHDGERVVREAMMKGMIVNIDHISTRARLDLRRLSRAAKDYPLNALHNNPNRLLKGNKSVISKKATPFPHEYDFDDEELQMVSETGGFFGVRVGPIDAKPWKSSGVVIDCPKTMTETAQVLAYLLDKKLSIGYSLDYATITKAIFSRTYMKCDINGSAPDLEDDFHTYTDIKSGRKFKTEGLTHIGMMKKFHRELETIGFDRTHLDKLRNDGAEQFVRMWEASERKSAFINQIPRQIFAKNPPPDVECTRDNQCRSNQFCAINLLTAAKNQCKAKKGHRAVCTAAKQCLSGRCSAGLCAKQHECRLNNDCAANEYCAKPVGSARECKPLKRIGQSCTGASQCASGRCSGLRCARADQCSRNSDCRSSEYCSDPIAGQRKCKAKLAQGKRCTKGLQCGSGCCKPHISAGGLPICRPSSKCR